MQYYGILGSGDAKKRVIEDGLADYLKRLGGEATALIAWLGRPPDGQERALDYLIDHDLLYRVYFEEGERQPPRAVEKASDEVIEVRDPVRAVLRELAKNDGELLMLFDPDDESASNAIIEAAVDLGISVLELNNGLGPLLVEGEPDEESATETEPEEAEEEQPKKGRPTQAEDTAEPLSEAEIRAMTGADMRKMVKAMGVDTKGLVKADLLEILLKGEPPARQEEEVKRTADPAKLQRSADPEVRRLTDTVLGIVTEVDIDPQPPVAAGLATVVIVLPEGSTVVRHLEPAFLQGLLP